MLWGPRCPAFVRHRTKRESKSVAYRDTRYNTLFAAEGSFTDKSDLGIRDASKSLFRCFLEPAQDVLKDSWFRDDLFEKTSRIPGLLPQILRLLLPHTWQILPPFPDSELQAV